MRHMLYILMLALLLGPWVQAQNAAPAPPQSQPIAITGATAHLGNGQVIENALITFANGKLTQVASYAASADLSGHQRIDATGKHVYPGFIALNTQLGIVEIGAVRATRDSEETGDYNPNVRSLIAYNTDSQVIPTVRSRGTLMAQVVPDGDLVAGQSSVVQLDAWNWEDAVVRADDGLHIYWPRRVTFRWWTGELVTNENYAKQISDMEQFLREADAYCTEAPAGNTNLRLAALCPVLRAESNLYLHVQTANDIKQAVDLARELGARPIVVGGRESYLITDYLSERKVPVILDQPHSLPARADEDIDQPFKTAAQLAAAGVQVCLSMEGFWQQRNLAFQAGTAVAYGMPYEAAVRAITLEPARVLGLGDRLGSLEVGKEATLIISTGDALDMRTSQIERAFLSGRDVNLDNKQDFLYRKFKQKYDGANK